MKLKSLFVSATLCLSLMIVGASQGAAQQVQALDPEWLTQMYQEGWQKVQEGVLQRNGEGGGTETFTYGEDGLQFSIQKLQERVAFLENEYNAHPTEELAEALEEVQGQLVEAQGLVGTVAAEPFNGGEDLANCDIAYGAHASATHLTGSTAPGVTASASAYFHSNCGHTGNTNAFAYSTATIGTTQTVKSQEEPKNNGSWFNSSATASVSGNLGCFSTAYGRTWSPQLGFDYTYNAPDNYNCPIPVSPPVISGPTNVYTDAYYSPCATVTWTVNTTSGYSYNWYIGSTHQGSGGSLTKTYCNQNATINLTVVRSDNAQDTHTTYVSYDPYSGGGGDGCIQEPGRPYVICQ